MRRWSVLHGDDSLMCGDGCCCEAVVPCPLYIREPGLHGGHFSRCVGMGVICPATVVTVQGWLSLAWHWLVVVKQSTGYG